MHTTRLISTVIVALILMASCDPPVSDNPTAPAAEVNDSASGPSNSNAPASGGSNPKPKAIVVDYVSAGYSHTMILKTDGTLWAVGNNQYGQLGNGNTDQKLNPVKVMDGVAQVSAGDYHTIILKTNDSLWAAGQNNEGQLGNGSSGPNAMESTPVQLTTAGGNEITDVKQISAGGQHSMILKENGELWAVGSNQYGQLGDGSWTDRSDWVQVKTVGGAAITEVDYVSLGSAHTMIIKRDGSLWAVGGNIERQLGDGTTTIRQIPVRVKEMPPGGPARVMTGVVTQVSAGFSHTMIVKENGELWAVGQNNGGKLGDSSLDRRADSVQVLTLSGVDQVSAGGAHTMILKENGELWATGNNVKGQLGDHRYRYGTTTPIQVMTGVAQVSAGFNHSMIVKENGELWAVGDNEHGQLGNGNSGAGAVELTPVEITVE